MVRKQNKISINHVLRCKVLLTVSLGSEVSELDIYSCTFHLVTTCVSTEQSHKLHLMHGDETFA